MKVTINMKASFDKKIDDKKTKEYENKLKEINFSSETSSNGLRLLSKEEYEKNIKLQNEVRKGFNNVRDLQSVEEFTSSMEYPFTFNYEIFKSNMLGVQVAIVASIKWIPTEGTILIKLYYVRGSKTSEIDTKTIVINNFSDVTKSYKTILITIISYLKDEIIKYIDNYNINISEDNIAKYILNFRKTLEPLSTLFEKYLQADLDNFKNGVIEHVKHCYNALYDDMEAHLLALLTTIENQIKAGTQKEINDLVNESKTTVINLINKQNQNLTNLIEKAKTFIDNAVKSINELKSYQKVGIDYYYRVKEIFKRIDVLIDTYQSTLISSIDENQLRDFLKDEMKQNPKLKKAFLDKFGQEDVIDKEYYIEKLDQVFCSGEDRSFVDFGIYNIDMMEYALSEFMDNELPKILEMREHSFASSLVEKIAEVLGDDLAVNHDSWYDLAEDFMEYVYILEDSIYLTSDERKSLESATSEIVSYL